MVALVVIMYSCKEDAVNNLPEATDDSNTTDVNTPVNGSVQTNDDPSEDGGNTWSLKDENGGAANGTVIMDESGNYTYTPNMNWYGTDEFIYQLCDANGDCVEATVTITVNPVVISLAEFNNLSISALAVDGSDKLWIASNNGLYTEVDDGYLLVGLGKNQNVTALAYESNSNTLWAGTEASIYKLALGESELAGDSISSGLLSNSHILSAFINENAIRWFGTKTGITRNEGETWQKEKFKKNQSGTVTNLTFETKAVTSIAVWEGNYFFATAGSKLWRTTGWDESVDAFTSASMWDLGYNGDAIADTMYYAFIDSNGYQWFGGQEGVQVHIGNDPDNYDPKSGNFSFKAELVNANVRCIAEAPNGDIWCGTENGISIGTISDAGVEWNASTETLSNNFVTSIIFQGNTAWVGTKTGLNKIDL